MNERIVAIAVLALLTVLIRVGCFAVCWLIGNFLGWRDHTHSRIKERGPFNWRIFAGPNVYWNWVEAKRQRRQALIVDTWGSDALPHHWDGYVWTCLGCGNRSADPCECPCHGAKDMR